MRNNRFEAPKWDPILLEVFKHSLSSIAEEMGSVLKKSSFSPNIKERRDYSCAVFNADCVMIAQAAHIPVHLGSMQLSVKSAVDSLNNISEPLSPGDMAILNDPFQGGTHLPDITLIAPVFYNELQHPCGYIANRAHHADIGGMMPGSMAVSQEIFQEGLIIPPIKLIKAGSLDYSLLRFLTANVRTPDERTGDLFAQIAANQRGLTRFLEVITRFGSTKVNDYMNHLLAYAERMMGQLLSSIPAGKYSFTDYLDDDGINPDPIPITATITIHGDHASVDFTGSAPQQPGSLNAVYAITVSAVQYVFRSLLNLDVPNNSGCLAPININAPVGTIVNAKPPAAVAGGNVETSQRIVDVLLGALATACPERIPAASQGTMNNITIGGWDPFRQRYFTYYETIGGGAGALPGSPGMSAVHSHMTNTLNTPAEAIEYTYPLRVVYYGIRRGSGGEGKWPGGDGIRRDIQVLCDARVTLLTDRRISAPYGLASGGSGKPGLNLIIRNGEEIQLGSKGTYELKAGDILSIQTPGGGGYGATTPE